MKPLPENYLKRMTPEARKSVGQRTAAEVMANGVATSEKALQKQIVGLLRLKGIEVNVSRMDKRKTDVVGWPDLTFCIYAAAPQELSSGISKILPKAWQTFACAWEIKLPQGKLSQKQERMMVALTTPPNFWRYRVIRSVDEAIAELKMMGIE